jgi:hypothetical protein
MTRSGMLTRWRLAPLALILTLAGCGAAQARHDPRSQVAAYLTQVDKAERGLAAPLTDVSRVAARIAVADRTGTGPTGAVVDPDVAALRLDLREIRALGRRLAAVPSPPSAARLRAMLVTLVAQQASLTRQTAELGTFLPRFDRALAPLVPASRRLERVLLVNQAYGAASVQAVFAEKEAALRAFQATLGAMLARLAQLRPPPVSAAEYRAQVAALRGMSTDAGRLATALASGTSTEVPGLLADFDRAAALPQSEPVARAQVKAARAYNRAVSQLRTLAARATDERLRLQYTLR